MFWEGKQRLVFKGGVGESLFGGREGDMFGNGVVLGRRGKEKRV